MQGKAGADILSERAMRMRVNTPLPSSPLLAVEGLSVAFPSRKHPVRAVRNIDFDIKRGERLALVGESGSGKSVTAAAILGLIPKPGVMSGGRILFKNQDLAKLSAQDMRRVRGGSIGMISQDPFGCLNPVRSIGWQIEEALTLHTATASKDMDARVIHLLRSVGLRDPERLLQRFPHELSGGMNQRVAIAMALAGEPDLLIADEPTTALDVTTQAGILELLIDLTDSEEKSTLLITHDMGVVARFATRVIVMYTGKIVETGRVSEIFHKSSHPYTRMLLESIPRIDRLHPTALLRGTVPSIENIPSGCAFHPRCFLAEAICASDEPQLLPVSADSDHMSACHFSQTLDSEAKASVQPSRVGELQEVEIINSTSRRETTDRTVLRLEEITKEFPLPRRFFGPRNHSSMMVAVDRVSFSIHEGECVGIVGESGCGKSTLARLITGLTEATSGAIYIDEADVRTLSRRRAREARRGIQAVFQDPGGSLDPQIRVGKSVAEPLTVRKVGSRAERWERAAAILNRVGISREHARRFPHQLSGGQKQRVALARSVVLRPQLIVCDEPVTSLDVSMKSEILELLREIQREQGIAILFISHDLAVIRQIAQRVVVMYFGQAVETADVEILFTSPAHPYSAALLDASPVPDPLEEQQRGRIVLSGSLPSVYDPPSGCPFHTRCWKARELGDPDLCRTVRPQLEPLVPGHSVACHFPLVRREGVHWPFARADVGGD
jgi:peptide/nickel transport system ATP-binding protein